MVFERMKRVRFHHCDPAGIVFYPQYLVLAHELVEDWFDEGIGYDYRKLCAELHLGIPMRHIDADFLAPSVHGDDLTFTLRVEKIGGTSLRLAIAAEKDGQVRFKVRQTVVWADLDAIRPVKIDDEWRARFARYLSPAVA